MLDAKQAREETDKANVVSKHIMGAIAARVQHGEYKVRVSSADVPQTAVDKLKQLGYDVVSEGRTTVISW